MADESRRDLARELGNMMDSWAATNCAATEGATARLAGAVVEHVQLEVWDLDGLTAFEITLSDGSVLECPGLGRFRGPIAELVRMAGGDPDGGEEQ